MGSGNKIPTVPLLKEGIALKIISILSLPATDNKSSLGVLFLVILALALHSL